MLKCPKQAEKEKQNLTDCTWEEARKKQSEQWWQQVPHSGIKRAIKE